MIRCGTTLRQARCIGSPTTPVRRRASGEIQAHGLGPEGARLVKDIERSAADYQRAQVQLPSLSQRGAAGIERWFETEIVPRERELAGALDRFVEQVEGAIGHVYDKAEADRNRLRRWIYGFLGLSILIDRKSVV